MGRRKKKTGDAETTTGPAPTANKPAPLWRLALAVGVSAIVGVVAWQATSRQLATVDDMAAGVLADWNLLVITLDTVRADHIGCYGHAGAMTPTIDGLARRGLRFAQAIAPTPMTLPSHCSLFTGLRPPAHGVRNNGTFTLPPEATTLAEILEHAGYTTGAFIAAFVLDGRYGLAQGFGQYDDDCNPNGIVYRGAGFNERSADHVTTSAIRWLKGMPAEERFFGWVHYFDAHHPYAPPPAYASAPTPYDGEIAFVDSQIARLLAAVGQQRLERTLVVITADHGEGLGEHGEAAHSYLVYDTTVHVPLILSAPGVLPAGVVSDRVVGLVDVMPSVLHLLGIDAPDADGHNLWTTPTDRDRAIYIETMASLLNNGWAPLFGLRRVNDKYIKAPAPEYYDVAADPRELVNRPATAAAATLADRLDALLATWPDTAEIIDSAEALDDESAARLAALGYVSLPAREHIGRRDPKDMIRVWDRVMTAEHLSGEGRHDEALAAIDEVLEADPGNGRAWYIATLIHRRVQRFDDAERCVRRALALSPRADGWVNLAQFMLQRGEGGAPFEDALARAAELDPDHGGIYIARGDRLAFAGDFRGALAQFKEALRRDPVKTGPIAREKIKQALQMIGE